MSMQIGCQISALLLALSGCSLHFDRALHPILLCLLSLVSTLQWWSGRRSTDALNSYLHHVVLPCCPFSHHPSHICRHRVLVFQRVRRPLVSSLVLFYFTPRVFVTCVTYRLPSLLPLHLVPTRPDCQSSLSVIQSTIATQSSNQKM